MWYKRSCNSDCPHNDDEIRNKRRAKTKKEKSMAF